MLKVNLKASTTDYLIMQIPLSVGDLAGNIESIISFQDSQGLLVSLKFIIDANV